MKHMKKVLGFVLAGMMLVLCAACGSPKKETGVCTYEQDGYTVKFILEAENDVVQKITQVSTLDISLYTEDDVALIEESMDEFKQVYAEINGVEYSVEYTDTELAETIVIDASNSETMETLAENDLLPIEGEGTKISLAKTVESLESQGWTAEVTEE